MSIWLTKSLRAHIVEKTGSTLFYRLGVNLEAYISLPGPFGLRYQIALAECVHMLRAGGNKPQKDDMLRDVREVDE